MESYSYTVQNSSPVANIISLILCIIAIAGAWKVFVKAGIPGWHSLIPILNTYDLCKIALRDSVGLFTVLSILIFPVFIYPCIKLAKSFGKGTGFGLFLILCGPIARLVLGLGKARYIGKQ